MAEISSSRAPLAAKEKNAKKVKANVVKAKVKKVKELVVKKSRKNTIFIEEN